MTDAQRRSYNELSGCFSLPFQETPLDFAALFGAGKPVVAEIGFGMGTATAEIAAANPETSYIGIEVHKPGVGRLLWEIENRSLANIRVIEHDAIEVFERMFADGSLFGIHLFFPDPWQKKRHHKRRLVQKPFTDTLAAKLCTGGYLYMVTDWAEYGEWALAELSATTALVNTASNGGFAKPRPWRPATKFERKGLAKNHEIRELFFTKA